MPAVAVEGVGAVEFPVPPVEAAYHDKFAPLAVNGMAPSFRQYPTGVVTVGAKGNVLTVTTITALGLSHEPTVWLTQ